MSAPLHPDSRERDDLDDRIDAALRRRFAPPPAHAITAAAGVPPRVRWGVRLALVAAALLLLALFLAVRRDAVRHEHRHDVEPTALPALWVAAYHDAVGRGFASSCCDADDDLRSQCRALFSAALDLDPSRGVELCGAYCGLPAGGAAAILARCGDEPACVFVLPRARAERVPTGPFGGLHVHRRELGELVVFEVTRLQEAGVLPHLYVPEN